MPKALSKYEPGTEVELVCYRFTCVGARSLPVVLGREETYLLHHSFHGSGRFTWTDGTPVREFRLKEDTWCTNCHTRFASAINVSQASQGRFKPPIIFGYESESA